MSARVRLLLSVMWLVSIMAKETILPHFWHNVTEFG